MKSKFIHFDDLTQEEKFTLLNRGGAHLFGMVWGSGDAQAGQRVREILPTLSSADNIPPIKGNNEIEMAAIGMQNIGDYTMVVVDPVVLGQLNAKNTDYGNRYLDGLQTNMEAAFSRVLTLKEGSKRIFMIPHIEENLNPARSYAEIIEDVLKMDIYLGEGRTASDILGLKDAGCCLGAAIADINMYTDLRENSAYNQLLKSARESEGIRIYDLKAENDRDLYAQYPELIKEYMLDKLLIDPHEYDHDGNMISLETRRYNLNLEEFAGNISRLADLIVKARTTIPLEFDKTLEEHPELSKESVKMLRMINAKSFTCSTVRTMINNKKEFSDIYNLEGWIKLQEILSDVIPPQVLISRTGGDEFMINVWTRDQEMMEIAVDLSGVGAGNAFMGRSNTDHFIFAERARFIIEQVSNVIYQSDSMSEQQLIAAFKKADKFLHMNQITIRKKDILAETSPQIGEYIWSQLIVKHYDQEPFQDEDGNWQITINADQYRYYYNKIKSNDDGYVSAYQILSRYIEPEKMPEIGSELKIDLKDIPLECYKELIDAGILKPKYKFELRGVILPANLPVETKRAFSDNLVTLMKSLNIGGIVSWQQVLDQLLKPDGLYEQSLGLAVAREFLQINGQIAFLDDEYVQRLESKILELEQKVNGSS